MMHNDHDILSTVLRGVMNHIQLLAMEYMPLLGSTFLFYNNAQFTMQ